MALNRAVAKFCYASQINIREFDMRGLPERDMRQIGCRRVESPKCRSAGTEVACAWKSEGRAGAG